MLIIELFVLIRFHFMICMLFQIFCMIESKHRHRWQMIFDLGEIYKKILDFSRNIGYNVKKK